MVNRPDRPPGLEFRAHTYDSPSNASMTSLSLADLPSPRAGEIPPALSPLDALALQGRLLARRFEQESKAGRRMSRLAPLTIQNEFGNRSGFFSSLSNSAMNSPSEELPPPISPGQQAQNSPREQVSDRHRSVVPQFGGHDPHQFAHQQPLPIRNNLAPIGESNPARPAAPQGYFDIPRTHSPEPVEPRMNLQEATPVSPSAPRLGSRAPLSSQKKQNSMDSLVKPPQTNLLPPRSSSSQRSASPGVRPVAGHSYDDAEDHLSNSYDSIQQRRNLSPSSSFSRGHSPYTPGTSIPRSPSISSEYSTNGSNLPRPAFNFSRPMSRTSTRPSIDTRFAADAPSRQASDESAFMRPSFDSHPRRQDSAESPITNYTSDAVHTPVSMTSEDFRRSADLSTNPAPTTSYTYSKFSLPRGRKLDRRSIGIEDFLNSAITWDQPTQNARATPPSPESPPVSFDRQRNGQESPAARDPSLDQSAPSLTSSNSTIRARPYGAAKDISPQEHCDLGIELHEAGELLKSTYHLRLAARAGLPEAMFWYGLACRHGWGMRENKPEALQWFRKAVDSGGLEVADDEEHAKQGQPTDFIKKKQHKAQYAVAIYELGKCYMNGWGTSHDKPLALRCYEIAGNWGDADALVEAGYCYAEGVGAKKDMKKAARFYRAAEAKGVSMVGNSWIYKDKYMDDSSTVSDARSVRSGRSLKKIDTAISEKKPRDKSRTRTIFGRKKSTAA